MPTKVQRFFKKKYVRFSFIILLILAVIITTLDIWFINNADRLLINLVTENSGGKLKLQLSKASFDFFTNEVKIQKAKISSVGAQQTQISYQVSFQKVALTTNSLWSVFFRNALQIKKIKLYDPVIEVFRNKKGAATDTTNNLSLTFELGKLYNAAKTAIVALNTHSISLFNAKIILNNLGTKKPPLVFSNIFFTIKKLNRALADGENYPDKNNIIFNSSNQAISFTDGIHKISFRKLELENAKNIILDSCTIVALPSIESKSNYQIQFKKLALIGVDFETLYLNNLIKADSVYCESPAASLNFINVNTDTARINKGFPEVSKILKIFAGNIDIKFLGVTNAEIKLTVTGKKIQSELHNAKLNFQIKGLRINPDSSNVVSVASFGMLIKGYQLYNKDSSSVFSFDSVRFGDKKLLLNNFSVHTNSGKNKIRNFRDYSMPYFELRGVDWPELIFNQNLNADEAILINPTINYKKNEKLEISKRSLILSSRNNFGDFMNISKLAVVNGNVDIQWEENKSLTLEGFNLNMSGDNLADYKNAKFQNNIQSLFFKRGHLSLGDINGDLKNITFKKNNQVHADELEIKNSEKGIDTKLEDVAVNNISVGKNSSNIVIDGLQWASGNISIDKKHQPSSGPVKSSLLFKNVSGKNTKFLFVNKAMNLNVYITSIDAVTLQRFASKQLSIVNFKINGKEIKYSNTTSQTQSSNFTLTDNMLQFEKSHVEKKGYTGTLVMDIPSLRISGSLNDLFTNNFNIKNILLTGPKISFKKQATAILQEQKNTTYNPFKISHITMVEPEINFPFGKGSPGKIFTMPYSKGSEIRADDIEILQRETKINSFVADTKMAEFSNNGKYFSTNETFHAKFSKIDFNAKNDSLVWQATINKLNAKNESGFVFKMKQGQLFLKDINISELPVSSSLLNNIAELFESGKSSVITTTELKYATGNSLWQLNNVNYNSALHELVTGPASIHPALSRDAFIAAHPYQTDYMNFTTENAKIYGIDLSKYFNAKVLSINKATVSKPMLLVYRDKLPPFLGNTKKPLFTEKIKNIAISVMINQIDVDDGKVSYIEKNEKNRLEGNLLLTQLNGTIANVNSRNLEPTDSLSLNFTGKLQNDPAFELKLKESYSDPLSGFTMSLKIDPTSVLFLNPLLEPLSNVKFIAGHINKFEMKVSGNDNAASGDLKFYYDNLHINLITNGGLQKTGFLKKRESDLVNFFLIKNNNKSRTGLIYFKRLKNRSFFNYMNKLIFSGVVTSVGAKSNGSYRKSISDDETHNK